MAVPALAIPLFCTPCGKKSRGPPAGSALVRPRLVRDTIICIPTQGSGGGGEGLAKNVCFPMVSCEQHVSDVSPHWLFEFPLVGFFSKSLPGGGPPISPLPRRTVTAQYTLATHESDDET